MVHIRPTIQDALKNCGSDPVLPDAAKGLLDALGYVSERVVETDGTLAAFIEKFEADNLNTKSEVRFLAAAQSAHLLFQFGKNEIDSQLSGELNLGFNKYEENDIESFLFFAVELKKDSYTRSQYAEFTREINKRVLTPSVVLFRCGAANRGEGSVTLSFIERRQSKTHAEHDVLKKVSLLRDIQCREPHRGHLNILEQLTINNRLKWMKDNKQTGFDGLLKAWLDELNAEALNRRFYLDLVDWFERTLGKVKFPSPPQCLVSKEEHLIRMISRMLFIWFMKEKGLIARDLFSEPCMEEVLHKYNRETGDSYYRAILQNLFFATLNTEISKRKFSKASQETHRDFSLYRYRDLMAAPEKILSMMKSTPFVNGGLFDCLDDHESKSEGGSRIDCFSDNTNHRKLMSVPNILFFDDDDGLFRIFNKYKFTVEENTPIEQEVALDPELLGKVFENLLGYVDRRETGSYYTPRIIVDYMVRESLTVYFVRAITTKRKNLKERIYALLSADKEYESRSASEQLNESEITQFVAASGTLRLLDPAVGSGAFPMGALAQLTMALLRVDPENKFLKKREVEHARKFNDPEGRKRAESIVQDVFSRKNKFNNYGRKLSLIRDCLFGVDIHTIAVQICRLRFFISLLIEQQTNDNPQDNFGIRPLPNMETKIIAADTLIKVALPDLFSGAEKVKELEAKLLNIRRNFFNAQTRDEKRQCKKQDKTARKVLANHLVKHNYPPNDANKIAEWDLYDQTTSANWFDAEWMFGITDGFNIVIGNPPYIQLQNDGGKLAERYQGQNYHSFIRSGDIYCLFYERGLQLAGADAVLCYITSNKWMRAGYGAKLRAHFATTNPLQLLNFGGLQIFENVTVDTNILLVQQATPKQQMQAVQFKADYQHGDAISTYVNKHAAPLPVTAENWSIASPTEQALKEKIEQQGVPLAQWDDVQIYLGIITGYNKAFIIDEEQRQSLLNACQDMDERKRTETLFKPILRGRNIHRHHADWAERYLITIPTGWTNAHRNAQQATAFFHSTYPALLKHFQHYDNATSKGKGLYARDHQGDYWWELRPCDYYPAFEKEKIVWKRIGSIIRFAFDASGTLCLDSACILTGGNVKYIMAILNSKLGHYLLQDSPRTGTGDLILSVQAIDPIPIPRVTSKNRPLVRKIELLIETIIDAKKSTPPTKTSDDEAEINDLVYELYGITEEAEQKIIEGK